MPPPIGGVAVHLSRLVPHLQNAGMTVQMYNLLQPSTEHPLVVEAYHRRIRWLFGKIFGPCENVHYVAGCRPATRFAATLVKVLRKRKVILREGGAAIQQYCQRGTRLQRWMTQFAFCRADAFIGVNQTICDLARRFGVKAERIHCIPGFIPPRDDGSLPPEEVREFAGAHGPVLITSGALSTDLDGGVYSPGMILDLMAKLKRDRPGVGLIYYAYKNGPIGEDAYDAFKAERKRRGLSDTVLLHRSTSEYWPAFAFADLLVRATRREGDSNSVREAVSMGLPVVASDCANRPESVVTFPTGDTDMLYRTVSDVLDDLHRHRKLAPRADMGDNAGRIVELIKELLSSTD